MRYCLMVLLMWGCAGEGEKPSPDAPESVVDTSHDDDRSISLGFDSRDNGAQDGVIESLTVDSGGPAPEPPEPGTDASEPAVGDPEPAGDEDVPTEGAAGAPAPGNPPEMSEPVASTCEPCDAAACAPDHVCELWGPPSAVLNQEPVLELRCLPASDAFGCYDDFTPGLQDSGEGYCTPRGSAGCDGWILDNTNTDLHCTTHEQCPGTLGCCRSDGFCGSGVYPSCA